MKSQDEYPQFERGALAVNVRNQTFSARICDYMYDVPIIYHKDSLWSLDIHRKNVDDLDYRQATEIYEKERVGGRWIKNWSDLCE